MNEFHPITMSDPQGIALVVLVALIFLGIRLLPHLLAGVDAYISAIQLKARLDEGEEIILLDVRSEVEFHSDIGHLCDSQNLPLPFLKQQLAAQQLVAWQDKKLVVICRSDTRAAFAVRMLKKAGFSHAKILSDGIMAWLDKEFEVCGRE